MRKYFTPCGSPQLQTLWGDQRYFPLRGEEEKEEVEEEEEVEK